MELGRYCFTVFWYWMLLWRFLISTKSSLLYIVCLMPKCINISFINIETQWLNQTVRWFESINFCIDFFLWSMMCYLLLRSQFFLQRNILVRFHIYIMNIYILLYTHTLGSLIGLSLPNAHTHTNTPNLISNCFIIYLFFPWIPCDYFRYFLFFSN